MFTEFRAYFIASIICTMMANKLANIKQTKEESFRSFVAQFNKEASHTIRADKISLVVALYSRVSRLTKMW